MATGMTVPTFSTVNSMVKDAMSAAIERILTGKGTIDVLNGVRIAKQEKRVYSIVFCGVNGVGKSTNLAKVCYFGAIMIYRCATGCCRTM